MKSPPILPTVCHFCGKTIYRRATKSGRCYCNFDCKAQWQRTQKPVTKEWLFEHYVTKGMGIYEIGRLVKRDPKNVWFWLKDFGIETRKRGYASPCQFVKGHKLGVGRVVSQESRKKMSDHAKATGRVPYKPEVGSYMKGKSGAQTPNWKGGVTAERQAFYGSPEWKKAASAVWARDKKTCQRCDAEYQGRTTPFDIHHIVSFQHVELRAEPSNLVLLCEPCHYFVHSKKNKNREFIATSNTNKI